MYQWTNIFFYTVHANVILSYINQFCVGTDGNHTVFSLHTNLTNTECTLVELQTLKLITWYYSKP